MSEDDLVTKKQIEKAFLENIEDEELQVVFWLTFNLFVTVEIVKRQC